MKLEWKNLKADISMKIHFNTTSEFEKLFKSKSKSVTDSIVSGIEKAMMGGHRTALIYEITFEDYDRVYEISLPFSQWETSLTSCLDHYHEMNMSDEAIDTWKLLEAVKVW